MLINPYNLKLFLFVTGVRGRSPKGYFEDPPKLKPYLYNYLEQFSFILEAKSCRKILATIWQLLKRN